MGNNKPENKVGKKFGILTVINILPKNGKHRFWNCKCDCGNFTTKRTDNLNNGKATSCGCLKSQKTAKRMYKHGHSTLGKRHPFYSVWADMKSRCNNPKNVSYENYGKIGISYCKRWESFTNFLKDMGTRPKGYTLDRINPLKGYKPSNCRWASRSVQSYNSRNSQIKINKAQKPFYEWCKIFNTSRSTATKRINRGWCKQCSVSNPPYFKCPHITHNKQSPHNVHL